MSFGHPSCAGRGRLHRWFVWPQLRNRWCRWCRRRLGIAFVGVEQDSKGTIWRRPGQRGIWLPYRLMGWWSRCRFRRLGIRLRLWRRCVFGAPFRRRLDKNAKWSVRILRIAVRDRRKNGRTKWDGRQESRQDTDVSVTHQYPVRLQPHDYPSSMCKSIASPRNVATPDGDHAASVIGMLSERPSAKTTSEKK